ncbi:MAG: GNAT family N-acetyltransferase [Cyanobacteriota bacterium]|nr:GNAT family N-acetyltransferase [Cyanobacteriota bacterium]
MNSETPLIEEAPELHLRPVQLKDLEAVEAIFVEAFTDEYGHRSVDIGSQIRRLRQWYGPIKILSVFPNRFQHVFTVHVAEQGGEIKGVIQVSPFNHSRSTWRVDHLAVAKSAQRQGIGSRLLRHCMEHFREARTWILEVNIHNKGAMALYRTNGFQPLAQITYWSLPPEVLTALSQHEPHIAHLMPVSNRDAYLIYQLDTASMPPIVRQVYDRHVSDFKASPLDWLIETGKQSISNSERLEWYVYEPERKAAIGYFNLRLSRTGQQPHVARLSVHPAYTWLYPELMAQMARLTQDCPPQSLALASTDYQPEREEFLIKLGAHDSERTLLMSRSVWHKLRETRLSFDQLQLNAVLRSLQVNQPLPERIEAAGTDFWRDSFPDGQDLGKGSANNEGSRPGDQPSH